MSPKEAFDEEGQYVRDDHIVEKRQAQYEELFPVKFPAQQQAREACVKPGCAPKNSRYRIFSENAVDCNNFSFMCMNSRTFQSPSC